MAVIEFHVAGELQLKARRPKSVDKYGTWRSFWLKNGESVMAGVLGRDYKDSALSYSALSWEAPRKSGGQ